MLINVKLIIMSIGEVFREHTQFVKVVLPLPPTLEGPKQVLSARGSLWISNCRVRRQRENVQRSPTDRVLD
jgi:hypothetical protein